MEANKENANEIKIRFVVVLEEDTTSSTSIRSLLGMGERNRMTLVGIELCSGQTLTDGCETIATGVWIRHASVDADFPVIRLYALLGTVSRFGTIELEPIIAVQ